LKLCLVSDSWLVQSHTGMMHATASWPQRIAAAAAAAAACSNLCRMVHLSRFLNTQIMSPNLLSAWRETQPPHDANTLTGCHICSWRFGAKRRLPAVSAEPSSDSPAELLSRRAVLLPLAESSQLPQQLLHSPHTSVIACGQTSQPLCECQQLHHSINRVHVQ